MNYAVPSYGADPEISGTISNAKLGLDVIQILEASQQSIKNKGKEIIL